MPTPTMLLVDPKEVIEKIPALVSVVNSKGEIVYSNKTSEEGKKENFFEYIHPEDRNKAYNWIHRIFREKMNNTLLVRAITKGGRFVWMEMRGIYVEINSEPYCIILCIDVSDRIEVQRKSDSLVEYLKFLNSTLRHDISNTLTRIHLFAELLEEEYNPKIVEKIKESVHSGISLIRKMKELESSANEAKKSYSIKKVVEEVAKSFNLSVKVEGDARILANEGIYSVFENLFGNALKHGNASEIRVCISEDGRNVVVRLEDNGRGISEEIIGKIFDKGFTTGAGSGLGLYIVRKIVESYNGEIWTEKSENGAVFVLKFPAIDSWKLQSNGRVLFKDMQL